MLIAELALEYVKVLIWPVVTLVALVMFRHRLRDMIDRISKAKIAGNEIEFREQFKEQVQALKEEAASLEMPITQSDPSEGLEVLHLVRQNPAAGLAVLRMHLEREIRRILLALNLSKKTSTHIALSGATKLLANQGVLPRETADLILDVLPLANEAVHGLPVHPSDAEVLAVIGLRALAVLRNIGPDNSTPS